MNTWDATTSVVLAIGVLALSETLGRGVFATATPAASRAGWAATSLFLVLALLIAVDAHRGAFRTYVALAILASVLVHLRHARRPVPDPPSFLRANAGALLGSAPWLVTSQVPPDGDDMAVYGIGVACLTVLYLPLRWAWRAFVRRLAAWWPVREEIVGGSMWRFVRPRTVLFAFALAVVVVAAIEPGGTAKTALVLAGIFLGVGLLYAFYRLLRWLCDPLREGRIWYRPREQGSFALLDALAGAAIALAAISVACGAITTRQRLAAEAALEALAREALAEGMEKTWAMSTGELTAAAGSLKTPLSQFQGEMERTIASEEGGALWHIRVTVHWRSGSGGERSMALETLRAAAGGRR